jgi:predicted Rossmann-fold nucleotide-binding protein
MNTPYNDANAAKLREHVSNIKDTAINLEQVLHTLLGIGRQGTWLGSRKQGPTTAEYKWVLEAARLLALHGFAAKTGGGTGLMEAPHLGCHLAGKIDRAVAIWATFIEGEVNPFVKNGGWIFDMPDFNSRHDALFFGSQFQVVLPGRLGTLHEMVDLLNRHKYNLLARQPIYFVERDGYWSDKQAFFVEPLADLGPRITPEDYDMVKVVDIFKTPPESFAQMVLRDLGL